MNKRMNKWVNEWMNRCSRRWKQIYFKHVSNRVRACGGGCGCGCGHVASARMRVCVCMYAGMHACIYMYTVCMYVWMPVFAHVCARIRNIYIYIYDMYVFIIHSTFKSSKPYAACCLRSKSFRNVGSYGYNEREWMNIKEGQVVLLHAMNGSCGDSGCSSYSFLISALEGGEWLGSRPGRALPPRNEPLVPAVQEAGWAKQPVSASVGDRTQVQSVVSHCTDWVPWFIWTQKSSLKIITALCCFLSGS
jgi:hypothetical protein